SERRWASIAQPITRRLHASRTTARYGNPAHVGMYVISASELRGVKRPSEVDAWIGSARTNLAQVPRLGARATTIHVQSFRPWSVSDFRDERLTRLFPRHELLGRIGIRLRAPRQARPTREPSFTATMRQPSTFSS